MTLAKLRLLSGLVLVGYLTTHFTNHAFGLVSLGAMDRGLWWFLLVWRSVPSWSRSKSGSTPASISRRFRATS